MSGNVLYLVPEDLCWQPTMENATKAAALLKTMAQDPQAVSVEFFDRIEIFHPLANWDGVHCPECKADVED